MTNFPFKTFGTSNPSFQIGGGATIYQGTALPSNSTGANGDIYLYVNTSASAIYVKNSGVWTVLSGGSAGVTNGDKGDITVSSTGSVWTVDAQAITYAKIQNVSANTILARAAGTSGSLSEVALSLSQLIGRGASGNISAITLGTGLSMTGTTLAVSTDVVDSVNALALDYATQASLSAQSAALKYIFNTSTTVANPTSGQIRLNNASLGSASILAISANSNNTGNPNILSQLVAWGASTNTNKGQLTLRSVESPTAFASYHVTAVTNNTLWLSVAITPISTIGTFGSSDNIMIGFSRSGDAGVSGSASWGAISGTLSSQTDLNTALGLKAPLASPTFTGTVSGITAAMVSAPSGSGSSTGTNTGDQTITLTGEATGAGTGSFAVTLTNASVIGKVLTGYTSGAGTITASDTILQAIQKLNGNDANPTPTRVVTLTDAATVTPNSATTDLGILLTVSQNFTLANPSGTPSDGQRLLLRIKSSAVRTITFGSQYRGSVDLTFPASTSGANLTDYLGFIYNAADTKWDYVSKNAGF